jgi:hypothetical protein
MQNLPAGEEITKASFPPKPGEQTRMTIFRAVEKWSRGRGVGGSLIGHTGAFSGRRNVGQQRMSHRETPRDCVVAASLSPRDAVAGRSRDIL